MKFCQKFILTFFFLFYFSSNVFAESESPIPSPTPISTAQNYNNLSLNEICPDPLDGNEWVEIYNPDGINVEKIIIEEKTGSGNTNSHTFENLGSGQFISVEFSSKLNNDGDTVTLKKEDGTQLDSYQYDSSEDGKSWSKSGSSWCKTEPTKNSSNGSCIIDPTPTPTPSPTPSSTPEPEKEINDIRINEVYPCPADDGNEWVEIYNNNDFEVNLNDWYLKDSADNTRKLKDLTIAGKSFIYFAFGSGFLNNDGDRIKLFDSQDREKYALPEVYPLISEGISWSYIDGVWCRARPTKGSANTVCLSDEEDELEEETSTPKIESKEEDSKKLLLNNDRDLPQVSKSENEASVAGTSDFRPENPKPNLTIPLIIASSGFLLLAGASYPFLKPKFAPIFAKLKKKKKK